MEEDANEEDPEIRGRLRELAQPLRFLDRKRLRFPGGGRWDPVRYKTNERLKCEDGILGSSLMFDDWFLGGVFFK